MQKNSFLILSIFCYMSCFAQFEITGKINNDYQNATAYLSIVKDYKKTDQFLAENVLVSSDINQKGEFSFTGDFLDKQDQIYKIYIDNCHENISNAKHLLNNCLDFTSINFIANNTDSIYFPLNNMNQMLCEFSYNRNENTYIKQIDSLQENLLTNLENTINNAQRKLIYKNYYTHLKGFSSQFDNPLAELYAYNLYANKNSFSREFYLNDLKKTTYYNNLKTKLLSNNLESYANQFEKDILIDSLPFKQKKINTTRYILLSLLLISLLLNYFLIKRNKKTTTHKTISYKEVLTKQEQRVFEEMHNGLSNKKIADKLFISLSTVKTHINNIYSKLQIGSRKEIGRFLN